MVRFMSQVKDGAYGKWGVNSDLSVSNNKAADQVLVDTFGRKHTYLRISLTEKCSLRCKVWHISWSLLSCYVALFSYMLLPHGVLFCFDTPLCACEVVAFEH
ncbi:hypothetical protein V5799_013821 [Amblyomma americanum]|uniref:Uncharacterized protein n=1 Tax=Amblyomma americanum TaxID=6943 RepID=A0AAQ4E4T8_AMBAM